jgi:hypothetical protein
MLGDCNTSVELCIFFLCAVLFRSMWMQVGCFREDTATSFCCSSKKARRSCKHRATSKGRIFHKDRAAENQMTCRIDLNTATWKQLLHCFPFM